MFSKWLYNCINRERLFPLGVIISRLVEILQSHLILIFSVVHIFSNVLYKIIRCGFCFRWIVQNLPKHLPQNINHGWGLELPSEQHPGPCWQVLMYKLWLMVSTNCAPHHTFSLWHDSGWPVSNPMNRLILLSGFAPYREIKLMANNFAQLI